MDNFDYTAIGRRIRVLRKRKGYNQQELAAIIGKSLRTVQKYESGEIEVSIAIVNQLAEVLESTPTYILGYETNTAQVKSLADVMNFLFQIEQVSGIKFDIDVKKPPRSKEWQCAITFDGKAADADFNTDMCLFLEQWEEQRDELRTFAATAVECAEPAEMDPAERIEKRNAYLNSLYATQDGDK